MIPLTMTACRSEFTQTCFSPCTTRFPFGNTWVTRAERVVLKVLPRLVVPCPCSCWSPVIVARFARGPAEFITPASEDTLDFAEDFRWVFVVPVAVADARSRTTIVTMSSMRPARISLTASASWPVGENNDPVEGKSTRCDRRSISAR